MHRPATLLAITMATALPLPPNIPRVPSEGRTLLFKTGHPALAVITTTVIVVDIVTTTAIVGSLTTDIAPTATLNTIIATAATELCHFSPSHLGCPGAGSLPSKALFRFRPRYLDKLSMIHKLVQYMHAYNSVLCKSTPMPDPKQLR